MVVLLLGMRWNHKCFVSVFFLFAVYFVYCHAVYKKYLWNIEYDDERGLCMVYCIDRQHYQFIGFHIKDGSKDRDIAEYM